MNRYALRIVHENGAAIEFHGPADITQEKTDAIVNAANSYLTGGGGVDGAIHAAGGPAILAECKQIVAKSGNLPAGRAVITTAGRLPARHVIHTVGPVFRGRGEEAELLASCYRESLRLAQENGLASVAFPSISTGAFGYPVTEAAEVAVAAVLDALAELNRIRTVRFVLFDISTLKAYTRAAEKAARAERRLTLHKEYT